MKYWASKYIAYEQMHQNHSYPIYIVFNDHLLFAKKYFILTLAPKHYRQHKSMQSIAHCGLYEIVYVTSFMDNGQFQVEWTVFSSQI